MVCLGKNLFQHTAARRRLVQGVVRVLRMCRCFNTQPPEGGWLRKTSSHASWQCFNTQPPEGGWMIYLQQLTIWLWFQHTAARRRLASNTGGQNGASCVSTHSRPKAAGGDGLTAAQDGWVSTHSRPKAAGQPNCNANSMHPKGFNTQPPEGGWFD